MTWENLTADAEALRQHYGVEQWAILGHSFGGMVALEYALRYPQRPSHLILLDTCGDTRWVQQNAPRILAERGYGEATVQGARRFFNGQLTPDEVFATATKFARAYYYRDSRLTLARQIPAGFKTKMRPEAQVFGFGQLLTGWSVMDRLGEIKTPTLVMAGRDDFQFPPEHQAILADRLPNGQLELIERAGHNAPMERPGEVIEAIKRFMAEALSSAVATWPKGDDGRMTDLPEENGRSRRGQSESAMAELGDTPPYQRNVSNPGSELFNKDERGRTKLFYAAERGDQKAVEALIFRLPGTGFYPQRLSFIEIQDRDGLTAADVAEHNGHEEIASLLRYQAWFMETYG